MGSRGPEHLANGYCVRGNALRYTTLGLRSGAMGLRYANPRLYSGAPGLRYAIAPGPNNPPLTLALNKPIG